MINNENTVTLKYEIAKDLIDTKQSLIIKEINKILKKWNEESIESLINHAKSGELEEAEHDAILIGNYADELKELKGLL